MIAGTMFGMPKRKEVAFPDVSVPTVMLQFSVQGYNPSGSPANSTEMLGGRSLACNASTA
jgi:hypothetical protein